MSDLIAEILKAPDTQLDASMHPLIRQWSDPPKAIQVLEVLDHCVHASLASGFTIRLFEALLDMAIKREDTTYETVVAAATWREVSN